MRSRLRVWEFPGGLRDETLGWWPRGVDFNSQ